ncbi:MAG: N-acetylmuramic acid 6-phosphate etherase [Gammaproteobacteria bacterium]|nr:N-acetylmuramic acid 6-phosphate etherase [Gammaproteobacteria bacterium]MDE0247117.1 N-acetylmuramic acid 6-phosphate etherase [Gammaproteobacteria bacterium]
MVANRMSRSGKGKMRVSPKGHLPPKAAQAASGRSVFVLDEGLRASLQAANLCGIRGSCDTVLEVLVRRFERSPLSPVVSKPETKRPFDRQRMSVAGPLLDGPVTKPLNYGWVEGEREAVGDAPQTSETPAAGARAHWPGPTESPPGLGMLDDRLTEQMNPRSANIDRLSSREIVDLINTEDRLVADAVAQERDAIARTIDMVVDAFEANGRLIYVGAGTSGRLGVLDAAEMAPTYGTEPSMVQGIIAGGADALVGSLEAVEDNPEDGARAVDESKVGCQDFVLGIAASGTTPFVHGALTRARERGARTGFLLCTHPSAELVKVQDVVIAPLVGPELVTGSTRMKAGTATKMILNIITTGAMVRIGKVFGNLMVDLQVTCQKLQDRGERILMNTLHMERPDAAALLEEAGGHVKTALLMESSGVGREEAARMLLDAGGVLTRLIGEQDKVDTGEREPDMRSR